MSGQYFSETEIDEIIGAVEETMQNAAKLAKGNFDDSEEEGDAPAMPADPAAAAPAAPAAPSGEFGQADQAAAPADPAAAPAPEMGAEQSHELGTEGEEQPGGDPAAAEEGMEQAPDQMGAEGDQALESDDGELSDDELHQIYASMDPSDLERHYMIIRSMLRDAYAKMEKSEGTKDQSNDGEVTDMAKKQEYESKISELEKSNTEMKKSLEAAIKAVELISKPERKAVTSEVQVLGKTESDVANGKGESDVDYSNLSKSEITTELNKKVRDPKLSKADRDTINGYLLRGEGQSEVIKLLGSN